ncbi:MAG: 4-hydroxy-tetrahydrodipicolinate synthase [Betaproteobacteria bacterium]|jgi:4-hydroxy-tetrahydrodipicolinate synthase|nr:4-hydroxy-tetrahydrodipicolinate synthase [Betaproteobacteria bacterium]
MITGSLVAITTPMHPDGSLDLASYRALIDWHIAEGTQAIVAVGTTGESPTVDVDEHLELIRVAVEQCKSRIPVIAGTGANSTLEAIELTREAARMGAAASLQVVPYYNKPTQEGLYQHYKTIAEACEIPIILYNVPGRTVADLSHETTLRLAQIPNIVGIKDATGNIERGQWLIHEAPKDFAIYSGDDGTAVALMLLGGHGNISVTANVVPAMMSKLCAFAMSGRAAEAAALQRQLLVLHRAMFIEANPIPVKWALARMGRSPAGLRLPLVELSRANQAVVEAALKSVGAIG